MEGLPRWLSLDVAAIFGAILEQVDGLGRDVGILDRGLIAFGCGMLSWRRRVRNVRHLGN